VAVSVERMLKNFELGLQEFLPLWEEVLSAEVLAELEGLRPVDEGLKFPDELWARVIYNFALAAHRGSMTREHLLKSLTPLYLGRVASFVLETRDSNHWEVENKIENLCRVFEEGKPYLIDAWDQPLNTGGQS
jgi:hypothetical protein